MKQSTRFASIVASAFLGLPVMSSGLYAETPLEAYRKGCAGCHSTERDLRKIPRTPASERRAWIEAFMARHPCERDDLKPLIVQYLLSRSER